MKPYFLCGMKERETTRDRQRDNEIERDSKIFNSDHKIGHCDCVNEEMNNKERRTRMLRAFDCALYFSLSLYDVLVKYKYGNVNYSIHKHFLHIQIPTTLPISNASSHQNNAYLSPITKNKHKHTRFVLECNIIVRLLVSHFQSI